MVLIHQKLAVVIVLAALLGTLWALYRLYTGDVSRRLIAAGWVLVALLAAQGIFGALLAFSGDRPASGLHYLVGPLTLLPLPIALLAAGRFQQRRAALLLALGWLLTVGLALRATGSGGLG
jgi:heme A synthase